MDPERANCDPPDLRSVRALAALGNEAPPKLNETAASQRGMRGE